MKIHEEVYKKLEQGRCRNCIDAHIVPSTGGFMFLGCYHEPYNGKWVAEIKDCPKESELAELAELEGKA